LLIRIIHIVNPLSTMIGVSELNPTEDRTEVAEGCDGLTLPAQGNMLCQRNIRELEAKDLEHGRKQDMASGDPAKGLALSQRGAVFSQKYIILMQKNPSMPKIKHFRISWSVVV
jgi:hypothetical protein